MRCLLYARVSTERQNEKQLSIPAQLAAMRDYARQRGWDVAAEYVEPGASARTADRPLLQQLLAKVRDEGAGVNIVLVHKIDRLARNVYDHATIKAMLSKHSVRLASVVENVDETVSGQLVENIMASIAEFYSANLSEETKKGMREKVLRGGWPHRPPRGYVTDRTTVPSGVKPHPRLGPLMRKAFEMYAEGWHSIDHVARSLAREGLVTSTGKPLSKANLRRLLSNSFYSGKVRWQGTEAIGSHEALVTAELFAKVQAVLHERVRKPGRRPTSADLPLRGLAICASCRGRMTGEWHRRWGYYRCSRQSYRRELCGARLCPSRRAHADMERILASAQVSRAVAKRIRLAASRILANRMAACRNAQGQVAELARRREALTRSFVSGAGDPAEYEDQVRRIDTREAEIARALESPRDAALVMRNITECLDVATTLLDLYLALDGLGRARLLKAVLSSVVVTDQGIAGYLLRPPFDALCRPSDASPDTAATALLQSTWEPLSGVTAPSRFSDGGNA